MSSEREHPAAVLLSANRVLTADTRTVAGSIINPAGGVAVTGNVFMQTSGPAGVANAPAFMLLSDGGIPFEVAANVIHTTSIITPSQRDGSAGRRREAGTSSTAWARSASCSRMRSSERARRRPRQRPRNPSCASRRRCLIGNQARLRGLAPPPRASGGLRIGAVDDPLEREADAMAERVMRMADPAVAFTRAPPAVSRKCAACEEEAKVQRSPPIVRRLCAACEEETKVRRIGTSNATDWDGHAAPDNVHGALAAPGVGLDRATRSFFEPRFGRDLADVRVHADAGAAQSAREIGARAYTVGSDIVFAGGAYAPATDGGRRLIAHELAHVVQQAGAGLARRSASRVRPTTKPPPDRRPRTTSSPSSRSAGRSRPRRRVSCAASRRISPRKTRLHRIRLRKTRRRKIPPPKIRPRLTKAAPSTQ